MVFFFFCLYCFISFKSLRTYYLEKREKRRRQRQSKVIEIANDRYILLCNLYIRTLGVFFSARLSRSDQMVKHSLVQRRQRPRSSSTIARHLQLHRAWWARWAATTGRVWRAHAEHTTTARLRHFPERALSAARAFPSVFSGETDSPPTPLLSSTAAAARTTTNHRCPTRTTRPPRHRRRSRRIDWARGAYRSSRVQVRDDGPPGDAGHRTTAAEGLAKRAISRYIHIIRIIRGGKHS